MLIYVLCVLMNLMCGNVWCSRFVSVLGMIMVMLV